MTVRELIEKLSKLNGDLAVTTWDPYSDEETTDVFVNVRDYAVLITNTEMGGDGDQ